MDHQLFNWLPTHPVLAALISIGLNILIAIIGVLPSTFISIGTVGIFGFKMGLTILIVGEATGAIISFILYRKGLFKLISTYPNFYSKENKTLLKLKSAKGLMAFLMVILLRLIPFVPSGAVTLTLALSKMGLASFSFASTIGKIPALFIETYSIAYVLDLKPKWQIGLIISVVVLFLINLFWKRIKESNTQ